MKKWLYLTLSGITLLALGASAGYFYRDRSAVFAIYDSNLADLSMPIFMMDALQNKNYDVLENLLASDIEGRTSMMVLLFDKHKFKEGEYVRCAVTRKARALYENKKILASREKLEELDYPYTEVTEYFKSNCEGNPSHSDWSAK